MVLNLNPISPPHSPESRVHSSTLRIVPHFKGQEPVGSCSYSISPQAFGLHFVQDLIYKLTNFLLLSPMSVKFLTRLPGTDFLTNEKKIYIYINNKKNKLQKQNKDIKEFSPKGAAVMSVTVGLAYNYGEN